MKNTRKFIDEFKAFAVRGNAVDMAVGIIIGGAFGKIVSSLVSDIVMPPIGVLIGGVKFTDLKFAINIASTNPTTGKVMEAVYINYGQFLQNTFDFLIVAFSVFLMVKMMSKIQPKKEEVKSAPEPTKEETLLTEIRDLLKEKNS
jgi:large conductance mechanosensitive channel